MVRELEGWGRARPIRVAFLVEETEHAPVMLDGIFADCYSRWGGRFSLIVPCIEGNISESYWPWLEAYDPDLVYSYLTLPDSVILDLHERLSPSDYREHQHLREPRLDLFGFKPKYDAIPMSSLSTIFKMDRYRLDTDNGRPIQIVNCWYGESPTRFLTDNLGTYYTSFGTEMYPSDASAAADFMTIVSPEKQKDRRLGIPKDINSVPNETTAFRAFGERRATSLSLASILFASKIDIRCRRWSDSFNLVVGNSFEDRMLFWNARLLIPNWLDNEICCLRLDPNQIDDPDFLSSLIELLNRRNHVNSGTGGQSQIALRSVSQNADQLEVIRKTLVGANPWSSIHVNKVEGLEEIVPSTEELRAAREGHRLGSGFNRRHDWMQFRWSSPIAYPLAELPDHLADAPPRQTFTTGSWCTDYIFQREGAGPRFSNTSVWILPRRWRMAGAFSVTFGNPGQGLSYQARQNRNGHLTVIENLDRPVRSIRVPTADEAIRYAMQEDGRWAERPKRRNPIIPGTKVAWAKPSNEARYLNGVLGMTGGLKSAGKFLLHPFLTDMFASFGGTPHLPVNKVDPTVARLRKMAPRQPTFDISVESERKSLGKLIVKAAQTLKNPLVYIKYEDLKRDWIKYREAFWLAEGKEPEGDPEVDWDGYEAKSLDECLVEMRRNQMLFQGHQWTCRECHHKNWIDIADLMPMLPCEVCKTEVDAPIAVEWLFRPNEFLIESLRDHSVLSLIWVLTTMVDSAKQSIIYSGPTSFGFDPDRELPDAEADLLVLKDGKAFLCEVKSSWTGLRPADIENLVKLSERLRPDVALLAVMEVGDGSASNMALIDKAKLQLAGSGIEFVLMIDKFQGARDDPYLF